VSFCFGPAFSLREYDLQPMSDAKQHATEIVRTLRTNGHQAYFAGGCVRDLLLHHEPADYDVSTSATPREVMQIFPQTYAVGEQFGVVLIPFRESSTEHNDGATESINSAESKRKTIEVATFRCDVSYTDGRHPDEVRFTKDPREDVERRDFTINGMMLDPVTNDILDYVGGQADLKAGTIRAIGDPTRRFTEDKLRMLRAVRFAARFEYVIDPTTMAAMQKLAPQIHQVSSERVREELNKMLTEGHARRAFELLDETRLLREVLPEISAMKGVAQPPQYHPEGDVFVHTMLLLEKLRPFASKTLGWGALLHDVGKPPTFRVAPDRIRFDGHVDVGVKMAEEILHRLRFSNDETEQILALIDNHMRFGHVMQMNQSTLKKFLRMPSFDEHLELHRLDSLSSHGILDAYNFANEQLRMIPAEAIRPQPLVTGRDLIDAGYVPGPLFKEILGAVEDAQLEGHLPSHGAAMQFVRNQFPPDQQ
jgi:poly(A) polymerase